MNIITINNLSVNASKGFDAMRGTQVLEHFDTYEEAQRYAKAHFGVVIRYWLADEE